MSRDPASRDAHPLEMIEAMTVCAYELGLAASDIAKRATEDTARFLAASAEFRHCFFAMRMGIRLGHASRLAANPAGAGVEAEPAERLERERPEAVDAMERDDGRERFETERDREGDYEPVSLPKFLKSLGLAAAGAEARRDELPAHVRDTTLPTLHSLLRQAKAPPDARSAGVVSATAVLARPPVVPASRSRLLTSTGAIGVPAFPPTTARRRDSG